ncbi:DUF1828 domain-containing protein [Staphylococcus pseudintermedius]|uniref:DUF1828 domain-containing protein n=1 Tax=Staphylococcus pseudintermedius TaxID=283734 RepID=UPI000C1BF2DE|nr:DUF1828 domain-containing protein [Staphylococcus pseudintermedius]EGQ0312808.1 DUF1828 domain-containing protein [Staphylococcus pseudintermedius]EGQ1313869.1 DUF1828 domain-containing protein [Staphylococcus pseudintermedius]EGQ1711502.1 DUF1828 domain-containing protein [Staphylococcus pseudintermedius]EGQ2678365.1 DUF1828 domain-containing protein [Staphylococcus pseudintermedius]EGQ2759849.1 DUF1828 domain-containing protein [Staphylococcus pseudintermedius]
MESIEQKMNEYFKWMKQNYKYKKLEDSTEITTPFINPLNDYIRIYLDVLPNNDIRLSDDSLTMNELELAGIDIHTKARSILIQNVLNQFNLVLDGEEIVTNVKNNSFAQSKHNLIQGILKIYDLTLTTKSNVSRLFYEEVFDFLYNEEILGSAKVSVSGESGIKYFIDFILPETKSKPEKLINFANHLDFNKVTTDAFMYRDVKHNRPSRSGLAPQMFIVANDVEHPITAKARQAAEHEHLSILHWSDKDRIKAILTQ